MQENRRNASLKDLRLELFVIDFKCTRAGVFAPVGKRCLTNATGLTEQFVYFYKL